jgi:hypothetical protein
LILTNNGEAEFGRRAAGFVGRSESSGCHINWL